MTQLEWKYAHIHKPAEYKKNTYFSLSFSSPNAGYRAAVFQVCKICTFNQSNAIVLTAKCKIFF